MYLKLLCYKMDSDKEDDASIRCLNELIDIVKKVSAKEIKTQILMLV